MLKQINHNPSILSQLISNPEKADSVMQAFLKMKKFDIRKLIEALTNEASGRNKNDSEWAGALESYVLTEKDGGTELKAEMDSTEKYEQYFQEIFPKALEKIKQLAEE